MDRRAWWATVHGFTKSWARLSDLTYLLLLVQSQITVDADLAEHGSTTADGYVGHPERIGQEIVRPTDA